jgi:hypothetical protein
MDIKQKISSLLSTAPSGLKASDLSQKIGCTQHEVNSVLYSNKSIFQIDENYIWTLKGSSVVEKKQLFINQFFNRYVTILRCFEQGTYTSIRVLRYCQRFFINQRKSVNCRNGGGL